MSWPSAALGAGHFSKCAKGRLEQESPPAMTLPVAPASPLRSPPRPPPGASRARATRADRCTGGRLPRWWRRRPPRGVWAAAAAAAAGAAAGRSAGYSWRPRAWAAVGGPLGVRGLDRGAAGWRAGVSREPAGGYKDKLRSDSHRHPGSRTRGGHGAGTPPAPTRPGPARPASSPRTCCRGPPRPRPGRHAGSARRSLLHAPAWLLWSGTPSSAVLVSPVPRAQRRKLAAHLLSRCLRSAYYVLGAVDTGGEQGRW